MSVERRHDEGVARAGLLFLGPSGQTHLLYLPNVRYPGVLQAWLSEMTPEDRTLLLPALQKIVDHVVGSKR